MVNWLRVAAIALVFVGGGFAAVWVEFPLLQPSWWQPVGAVLAIAVAYILQRLERR